MLSRTDARRTTDASTFAILLENLPLSHSRDSRRVRHRPRAQPSSFRCVNCRLDVPSDAPGTQHRNHCPACLWSRHVDDRPGDRAMLDECGSGMEPIAITVRGQIGGDGIEDLLNELRNAGAEAIAVDGVRIVMGVVVAGAPREL